MYPTRLSLVFLFTMSSSALASPLPSENVPVGTVQTLPVISISLTVGSTGRETRRAVYAPPPGWYVRSHQVVVTSRRGTVNYAVSTLPAQWDWRTDEEAAGARHASAAAIVAAYKVMGGGQFAGSQDAMTTDRQMVASSHHLLVIDTAARGCGLLQGGSGIELIVVAELVYLGR